MWLFILLHTFVTLETKKQNYCIGFCHIGKQLVQPAQEILDLTAVKNDGIWR